MVSSIILFFAIYALIGICFVIIGACFYYGPIVEDSTLFTIFLYIILILIWPVLAAILIEDQRKLPDCKRYYNRKDPDIPTKWDQ